MDKTIPQITKENQVIDHDSLHRYRTEIPNILLDIGLEPFELTLYLHIKRIAGDKGKCWLSNPKLAEKVSVGESSIKRHKKSLVAKGLIKVTPRKKANSKESDTDLIEIMDLWPQNFEHFKPIKVVSQKTEGGVTENGRGVTENGKEELKKKNTSKEPNTSSRSRAKAAPFIFIGSRNNVKLTQKQIDALKIKFKDDYDLGIEKFGEWLVLSGQIRQSHYRSILNWVATSIHNDKNQKLNKGKAREDKEHNYQNNKA